MKDELFLVARTQKKMDNKLVDIYYIVYCSSKVTTLTLFLGIIPHFRPKALVLFIYFFFLTKVPEMDKAVVGDLPVVVRVIGTSSNVENHIIVDHKLRKLVLKHFQ